MGLDQYAYVAARAGQREEFYDTEYSADASRKGTVSQPRELAYWRKHPNLHGWMEQLWLKKSKADSSKYDFNGVELELTWQDLEDLERAVTHGQLPSTDGFFFGNNADDHYREADLEFIKNARAELFMGLKLFYNSSW